MNFRNARLYIMCCIVGIFYIFQVDAQQGPACIGGSNVLYVSPNGSDSYDGSCEFPFATLMGANSWLLDNDPNVLSDWTIYVRGGIYNGHRVDWSVWSDTKTITIEAYPGEAPVFEGSGRQTFFSFDSSPGQCTRLQIRGLTIRHYISTPIKLVGDEADPVSGWNGCAVIEDNKFEEIGSRYDEYCNSCQSGCAGCIGYAAIDFVNSRNNIVRNNTFFKLENNTPDTYTFLHAVYLAHHSSDNLIYENFVHKCSGDAFRVRNDSNGNLFMGNYVDMSGHAGFGSWEDSDESGSANNILKNNIVVSPYPVHDEVKFYSVHNENEHIGDGITTFIDAGQVAFYAPKKVSEKIHSIASGDFDGDGHEEVVVSFEYDGFSIVISADGEDKYLNSVLYASENWVAENIVSGDFGGNGVDTIITYFREKNGQGIRLNRGTGSYPITVGNGSSLLNLGQLYQSQDLSISTMTSGNFDGHNDNGDELVTAFVTPAGETKLYQSSGFNSPAFNRIYSGTLFTVPAMTSGDFDGDGIDSLITVFESDDYVYLYVGDGMTSATNGGYFYVSPYWRINDLAAGVFESGFQLSLITAFELKSTGENRIYRGNLGGATAYGSYYTSNNWKVTDLSTLDGDINGIVTAYQHPDQTQIWKRLGFSQAESAQLHSWSAP